MPTAAATTHGARSIQHGRPPRAGTESPTDGATARARRGCWSTRIARTPAGVEVTVRGQVDQPAAALLDQLLMDLVVGQGNRVVTVDAQELLPSEETDVGFTGVASEARARGSRFTVRWGTTGGQGRPP